jgi:hypothetical protein
MVSVNLTNFITVGLMALFFVFVTRWGFSALGKTSPV